VRIGLLAAALALALAGCGAENNVYVASNTLIGLNAGVNSTMTSGKIFLGYERDFVAVIPKAGEGTPADKEEEEEEEEDDAASNEVTGVHWESETGRDLMAVLGCTDLRAKGIFVRGFTEYIATGQAARNFAVATKMNAQTSVVRNFFECLRDDTRTVKGSQEPPAAPATQPTPPTGGSTDG